MVKVSSSKLSPLSSSFKSVSSSGILTFDLFLAKSSFMISCNYLASSSRWRSLFGLVLSSSSTYFSMLSYKGIMGISLGSTFFIDSAVAYIRANPSCSSFLRFSSNSLFKSLYFYRRSREYSSASSYPIVRAPLDIMD